MLKTSVFTVLLIVLTLNNCTPVYTKVPPPVKTNSHIFPKQLDDKIAHFSKEAGIPVNMFKSIIKKESDFQVNVKRYEKHLKNAEWYTRHIPTNQLTNSLAFSSIGVCQVLYGSARGLGYTGTPSGLYDIDTNMYYSAKYLKKLVKKYDSNFMRVISAYNAGHICITNGNYKNYLYVRKIINYWSNYERKESGTKP
jgi:soluble lytic murein transglycosylase-like protein